MPATKAAILHAAIEIFAEKGYEGASIQEIADLAGVNKAHPYWYYSNKKDLYRHVLIRCTEQMQDVFLKYYEPSDDPLAAFFNFVYAYHEAAHHYLPLLKILRWEMAQGNKTLREGIKQRKIFPKVFNLLKNIVQKGINQGLFKEIDRCYATLAVFNACNMGFFWRWDILETFPNIPLPREISDCELFRRRVSDFCLSLILLK
ncbi:MAG: TetR/AcrR family transcriptional regulator [Peptococcaceae bacterium]|nr:TetR/AcrR family transcriptional regulator [Peptococcaceae bacterium]